MKNCAQICFIEPGEVKLICGSLLYLHHKNEVAIIILLDSLQWTAKVKKAVLDLTSTDLNNGEGIDVWFAKLDLVFKDESVDEGYSTSLNFLRFNKKDYMNMTDCELEFEHPYGKMMEYEIKLSVLMQFELLNC